MQFQEFYHRITQIQVFQVVVNPLLNRKILQIFSQFNDNQCIYQLRIYIYSHMENYIIRDKTFIQTDCMSPATSVMYLKKYHHSRKTTTNDFNPKIDNKHPQISRQEILQKCVNKNMVSHVRNLSKLVLQDDTIIKRQSFQEQKLQRYELFKCKSRKQERQAKAYNNFLAKSLDTKENKSNSFKNILTLIKQKDPIPPFGYYNSNYTLIQKKVPTINMNMNKSKQSCKIKQTVDNNIDIKYNLIEPKPRTFNMKKQLSRDHQRSHAKKQNENNNKIDIQSLQQEYEFNYKQQKKYPLHIPNSKFRFTIDDSKKPYSQNEMNNFNLELLKKYNFSETHKKFLYFRKMGKS